MYLKKISFRSCGICLLLLALSFSFDIVWAQEPGDTLWTRTYGGSYNDEAHSVQQTTDEGYIIAGLAGSSNVGNQFYLVKTDALGNTIWTQTYGGGSHDEGMSVQQTTDEGYVIAGYTASFGAGSYDFYVIKTDASGDALWTRTYGGIGIDEAQSVQQTTDEGYIIAGYTESFGAGSYDFYVVKTDALGDTIWTRTYGGSSSDKAWSVQQTTDEGYIILGYTQSFGAGAADFYLVKTDAFGDTIWTRTYGGSGYDFGRSIQQTDDGGYIVVGISCSQGLAESVMHLVRTDAFGDTLWTNTYGSELWSKGFSVQQTTDLGYIIAGCTEYLGGVVDFYVVKTDALGDAIWTRIYGGSDFDRAYSVQQTSDDGYIIAGITNSFGAGGWDLYLVKVAGESVSVVPTPHIPGVFALSQNYPNPFNPETTIKYNLKEDSKVTLEIYNIKGQKVKTLINDVLPAGNHSVVWYGKNDNNESVSSGIYFYRITAGDFKDTKKCVILK